MYGFVNSCDLICSEMTVGVVQFDGGPVMLMMMVLTHCVDSDIIRQNFYPASNLKDFFHNIHCKWTISFSHAFGRTNKL